MHYEEPNNNLPEDEPKNEESPVNSLCPFCYEYGNLYASVECSGVFKSLKLRRAYLEPDFAITLRCLRCKKSETYYRPYETERYPFNR